MHSVGIQGALAIKRQRKRRDEQKRAKERRYSIQSSESGETLHSPHGSTRRKHRYGHHGNEPTMLDTKVRRVVYVAVDRVVVCEDAKDWGLTGDWLRTIRALEINRLSGVN